MQLLKNKYTIITGGTAGIGKQIALSFTSHGANIAIFGTSLERANQVLEELEKCRVSQDQQFIAKIVNVSEKKAVDRKSVV